MTLYFVGKVLGKQESSIPCWGEWKLVQPLGGECYSIEEHTCLPFDSAIPYPGT